jgi:hypothetical protein
MFGLSGRQIFILLILFVLLFAGAQYIPAYFAAFQFNDYVRQEVKYALTSRKPPEAIRGEALEKAKELGIALTKDDIQIARRGPSFTVNIEYRWPIDLRLYQHELVFHASQTGEVFENAPH